MPYFSVEDIPVPICEGSFIELDREGTLDKVTCPREWTCPICGAELWVDVNEILVGPKKGLYFATVPHHYSKEQT
jgi:hypothetical protein